MPTPPAPLERLEGLIERVTFHSEESGFCVLRLKVRGERELVTVVGHAPSVSPGEYVTATGGWGLDREHGRQFRANTLVVTPPTTLAGIERYLGSGMVKGIGPVYAAKLVQAFGADVFTVIEQAPERLREVTGIGARRAAQIINGWADQQVIRGIMVFLHGHGVSTSRAVRIFKAYGADAVAVVEQDPYRLARDIRGIGFLSADRIAQRVGIAPDSPLRARAGVAHALSEATSDGHCGLPHTTLVEAAVKLLDIPAPIIQQAIADEVAAGVLVADPVADEPCIFLAPLHAAERGITQHVARLRAGRVPWPHIDADKALPWVEERLGISLAPSQQAAVKLALASKFLVITGGPGVGKTTLLKTILTILRAKGITPQLCAPTGRAAKRLAESSGLEAKTIHRLLEFNPVDAQFKRNEQSPLPAQLLVVDECSMIDVPLGHQLLKAVRSDAAVLLVGDVDQLPSVGPGQLLRDVISSGAVPVVRLTEVFRQAASSRIVSTAHAFNQGHVPAFPAKGEEADLYFVPGEEPSHIARLVVDLVQQHVPRRFGLDPIRDIQVLCPMNRGETGARGLNLALQQALNPPGPGSIEKFGSRFGIGDKVMQIENNHDQEVYNGDIGFVSAIDAEEQVLTVNFDGRLVPYAFGDLDELVLSYATTIHKSQGSEYPVVVMPVAMQHYTMLKRNLVYTGVTRGKQLVVLVGQRKALAIAVRGAQVERRWSKLAEHLARLPTEGRGV